jgi:hypothetical protein
MKRYLALGAVLTVLGAAGTAAVHAAAAGGSAAPANDGGLSIMPALIEHDAQPGELATLTVANRSATPLDVTVAPRPWIQAVTGKVSPDRRTTLPGVSVSQTKFTLQPGAESKVTATLTSAPSAGYVYGAIEVVGVPTDASTRKGVVLGYRLVGALRVLPAMRKYSLTAGKAKSSGSTAVIPVKNAGNTVDAVSGSVKVKGASGTKNLTVAAVKMLPGKTVNLPAGTKLAKGSYTATVTLTQRGKRALSVSKKFRVK